MRTRPCAPHCLRFVMHISWRADDRWNEALRRLTRVRALRPRRISGSANRFHMLHASSTMVVHWYSGVDFTITPESPFADSVVHTMTQRDKG